MAARAGAVPAQIVQNEDGMGDVAVSQSGRLVFTRRTVDSNIWELAAGESTPRQVIASTRWDGYPQLSPDGSRIAFSSNRSGSTEIWISDRDGKKPSQLTSLGGTSHSQRWSPDGSLLVFSCLCGDNRDIYIVRPDGSAPRRLTTDPSAEGRPSFSRDGKWIYFYSSPPGSSQIWKMPVDGGPAIQITTNGGYEAQESWVGKRVYFTRGVTRGGVIGLASVPADGGEEKLENEAILSRSWEVIRNGIVYVPLDKNMSMDGTYRGNANMGPLDHLDQSCSGTRFEVILNRLVSFPIGA
jgi:Tol biopolymer transport system component